ncbi:hypothetical protein GP905_23575, partial [Escherichia coli]|nr:hypothetical protein [Escherichia coli]
MMPMQQNLQPRSRLTLKSAALAMMLTAGASIALAADLTPKTAGQLSYICGGVAQD